MTSRIPRTSNSCPLYDRLVCFAHLLELALMVALTLLTWGGGAGVPSARLRAPRLNSQELPAGSCEDSAAAADDSALSPSPIQLALLQRIISSMMLSMLLSTSRGPWPPAAPSFQIVFAPFEDRVEHTIWYTLLCKLSNCCLEDGNSLISCEARHATSGKTTIAEPVGARTVWDNLTAAT